MGRTKMTIVRHIAICVILLLVQDAHLESNYLSSSNLNRLTRVRVVSAAVMGPSPSASDYRQLEARAELESVRLHRASGLLIPSPGSEINDDNDDPFNIIEWILSFVDRYLPTINLNYTINTARTFEHNRLDVEVENYYDEQFGPNATLDQLQLLAIKAALRMAPIPLHTSWGYESRQDLRMSSLPVQDDTRCAAHLSQLAARLDKLSGGSQMANSVAGLAEAPLSQRVAAHEASPVENFEAQLMYKSTDLPMLRYLDNFGRAPSDIARGNVKWYGSYSGCMDTTLKGNPQFGGTKRIKFRYCMGSLKSRGWNQNSPNGKLAMEVLPDKQQKFGIHTNDAKFNNYFFRLGLCLPEACDSSAMEYNENARNIEKLAKFNLMKPFNSDHYYINDLYCLPDNRSPLRSIPLLGKLLILATLGWLSLIALATMIHLNVERFYTKAVREIRRKQRIEHLRQKYELEGNADQCDEEQRVKISAAMAKDREAATENQTNEFRESDPLKIKQNWIRFNVFLWDTSRQLVKGVDLIGCLSLYSNWLKYTHRVKLAVAAVHAEEQRRERIRARNEELVEEVRRGEATRQQPTGSPSSTEGGAQKRVGVHPNGPEFGQTPHDKANGQAFDRELNRRLVAQDEQMEFEAETIKRRVDTSSLNAMKVIALVWIIAGHCIFYLGSSISNGAILKNYVRDLTAFALANGAMYIVDLFFVITGCLTAYFAFKYNTFRLDQADEGPTQDDTRKTTTSNASTKTAEGRDRKLSSNSTVSSSSSRANCTGTYMEARIFRLPFWLMIVINRYLRILPTYLVVYAYVRLVSIYVAGAGQTWDYAVSANSVRRVCATESWLNVLTLTSNFVPVYGHCILGGWYLSSDMQFMVMAVPLLMVLAGCQRRKLTDATKTDHHQQQHQLANLSSGRQISSAEGQKQQKLTFISDQPQERSVARNAIQVTSRRLWLAYGIVFSLAALSALLSMVYGIIQSEVDLSYIIRFVPHAVAVLSHNIGLYTNSIFRFRSFACGLIVGHLLYLHEFNLIKLPKIIQQHGAKITTIIFSIGFCLMFLPVLYPKGKIILSHDVTAILMIAASTGVDIFLGALMFLVCIGKAPKIALFVLNSPFWSCLSSLSLCAFLVHAEIIVLLTSRLDPLPTASYSLLVLLLCATVLITYGLALALHLSFEMPFSRLVEALMRKYLSKSQIIKSQREELEAQTSSD